MFPNPKTTKKPTTVPPHISINNGPAGMFQVAILCACMVGRHMSHVNFGAAVPGEALETIFKLCLWALWYF